MLAVAVPVPNRSAKSLGPSRSAQVSGKGVPRKDESGHLFPRQSLLTR